MPFTWDDSNQKRLLLTILHLTAPSPPKWEEVAKLLGEGCSAEAARQQFKNLKKKAKEEFGEMPASSGGSTPAKGGRGKKAGGTGGTGDGTTTPKSGAGSKRKKGDAAVTEAGEDDEEETPVKKAKTKTKTEVKAEDDGEENDDGLV